MDSVRVARKVLVVDDDPIIGKSFDRVLSGKGYAVITARDGEEALQKLGSESYDVVFADIKMPGMSGIEVARRLKESQPWLPVVIITGYGTEANEARAKAVGVSGFLRKPLSPEIIADAAETTLACLTEHKATEAQAAPAPTVAEVPEVVKKPSRLLNVALFFSAPFIGLAYLVALPFVGLGVLVWTALRAFKKK